ncbi:uncharacterized protein LOC122922526 [Bufo gargarizans]|uniref:uncharacterized protein LOC122922526 n=1 Tax=Bufo gargarizans TaxID=30331 RepID=UPI001CF5D758|nr:uncharacterized protein LOC122922526 [Bufo gargarizans]
MEIQAAVLCMQVGKCFFNFLPFLFLREARSQSSTISLLILLMTDTVITGFLLGLWFGGWLLSPSTDVVFLRFLSFQNETYRSIPLLIPWICFSEEWSRPRMNKWSGQCVAETPLSVQSRLLSLTCWLIAALYGKHMIPEYLDIAPECAHGEWECLFTYIHASRTCEWLLLAIGLVLGATLFHSTMEKRESISNIWFEKKRTFKQLVPPLLLITSSVVAFYFLPPFIAVCSWSILALDSLCSFLRFQVSQPLNTVYSALEQVQVKDGEHIMPK